jgi:hypothetical protein
MVAAFNQDAWKYGKIKSEGSGKSLTFPSQSKTKLGDIEFKLGLEWLERDPYHLESYIGLIIPTGNKTNGEYIFEPVVGRGHHLGIMWGSTGGFKLWDNKDETRNVRVEYALHSEYLFQNTQVRSFDLKDKPFSRYMQVYASENDAVAAFAAAEANESDLNYNVTPGINVFTKPLHVTPGFTFDMNVAGVLSCERGFQGELGYNMLVKRAESVKLACPWIPGPALRHYRGFGWTNPIRDITGNWRLENIQGANPSLIESQQDNTVDPDLGVNAYSINQITGDQLDMTSAAHPNYISYTIYGTLGYRWDERNFPLEVSAGGSYEWADATNAVMDRWMLWAKLAVSF